MAKLERERTGAGPLVRGFSGRGFRIGDEIFTVGLLLTPEVARGWSAPTIDALRAEHLTPLVALAPPPEFILVGTGATLRQPSPELAAVLDRHGIGLEAMDSRAAARAWNVLRAEGRGIAAALLPIG